MRLFQEMFKQRRPTIIRDINCIGASKTLLIQQDLETPKQISLPLLVAFFDDVAELPVFTVKDIYVEHFIINITNLCCWVKHFYDKSPIPELTRIKAMQRCMNLLIRVLKFVWREYYNPTPEVSGSGKANEDERRARAEADVKLKLDYMELIRQTLQFFDWLCINNKFQFLFNEESGRANLAFIINACNMILC